MPGWWNFVSVPLKLRSVLLTTSSASCRPYQHVDDQFCTLQTMSTCNNALISEVSRQSSLLSPEGNYQKLFCCRKYCPATLQNLRTCAVPLCISDLSWYPINVPVKRQPGTVTLLLRPQLRFGLCPYHLARILFIVRILLAHLVPTPKSLGYCSHTLCKLQSNFKLCSMASTEGCHHL